VNGEIYNHKPSGRNWQTTLQDCIRLRTIIPLYERRGVDFLDDLSGIYAFVLYDKRNNDFLMPEIQ